MGQPPYNMGNHGANATVANLPPYPIYPTPYRSFNPYCHSSPRTHPNHSKAASPVGRVGNPPHNTHLPFQRRQPEESPPH
ncbi:MAG: hypothetical protein Fur0021_14650 [Candidatus Promineifilaceae bacterium]